MDSSTARESQTGARVRALWLTLGEYLEREGVLGYVLISPAILILGAFVAYPFLLGIWYSLTDKVVAEPAQFVGLRNFIRLLDDSLFLQTFKNTLLYVGVTNVFRLILGMAVALLMNQRFPLKNLVRALLLLPWIVPTALSTLAWLWIFDSTFSVINWCIVNLGLGSGMNWLGDPTLARISVYIVNVWRGVPFFAISLLAALQTIPQELYDAASIDGADAIRRFWHITLPLIQPVLLLVVLLSVIWRFTDFQIVYILTRGGPVGTTHLFGTLAYAMAMTVGEIGTATAISIYVLPMLLVAISVVLWQIRRSGT